MYGQVTFLRFKEVLGKAARSHLIYLSYRLRCLPQQLEKNINIKRIYANGVEIKLSQYADDTTLILDWSHESLLSSIAMLDDFSKVSGLRLNDKKTEALWIGASIGNDKIQLSGKELKWPKDKVKSLGLWISTDRELSASLNYNVIGGLPISLSTLASLLKLQSFSRNKRSTLHFSMEW